MWMTNSISESADKDIDKEFNITNSDISKSVSTIYPIPYTCNTMSFKKQRMIKIKLSGSDLADLDFWSKSDPFLVMSRPKRNSYGLQQVKYACHLKI